MFLTTEPSLQPREGHFLKHRAISVLPILPGSCTRFESPSETWVTAFTPWARPAGLGRPAETAPHRPSWRRASSLSTRSHHAEPVIMEITACLLRLSLGCWLSSPEAVIHPCTACLPDSPVQAELVLTRHQPHTEGGHVGGREASVGKGNGGQPVEKRLRKTKRAMPEESRGLRIALESFNTNRINRTSLIVALSY